MRRTLVLLRPTLALLTILSAVPVAAQQAAPAHSGPEPASSGVVPEPAPPNAVAATAVAVPEQPTSASPTQQTPAPDAAATTASAANAPSTTAPGATPAAEEAKPVPSYLRLDHDYMFGLQLWAGATYPLTDAIGIATDIYVAENYPAFGGSLDAQGNFTGGAVQSYWGEFDLGPSFTIGKLTLTPMVGVAFDWAAKRAVAINGPQLYTVFNHDKIYFESWVWTLFYSAFRKDGPNDYIHTRNWLLYKLTDVIALGPQLEYSYDLEAKQTVLGFPVGGHVELAYGAGNSLGLFLGYDTKKSTHAADDSAAVGRITFVHNF